MKFVQNKSVIENDLWKVINTNDLPEGIQVPKVELIELLTNQESNTNVLLPLVDKIKQEGLMVETLKVLQTNIENDKIGVWIDSHATVDQLDQLLEQESPAIILIDVNDFNNGRAFSLAQHLRLQGYEGEIRLTGNFGIDQLAYYQQSGIDTFAIDQQQLSERKADLDTAFDALKSSPNRRNVNDLPMFQK